MDVFCSTIIPTIGRPSLSVAVHSVLEQDFRAADFEIIVVNDSGRSLPEMDWQRSERVRVLDTNRRERSVARNSGAAVANGQYLHFLDDDDVLLPGALGALWQLQQATAASWLYGAYRTVDNRGNLVAEWRPGLVGDVFALLVAGESIPLQTSMIETAHFFAIGGFDANPGIIGVEDRELGRRMALNGALGYTPAFVAQIRIGAESSTTNWAVIAERDRWGREKSLRLPTAARRLRESAASSYWRGRTSRAYLASMVWNVRHGDIFTATQRAANGLLLAAPHLFAVEFWRGLRTRVQ